MKTQSQLNAAIDAAVAKYNGKKVAYKNAYPGECVSLVKSIQDDLGVPMPNTGTGYGDGFYTKHLAPIPENFVVEKFVPGKHYPKGTILTYSTHHVAHVLESNGGSTTKVFEQNANPDGSPAHIYDRSNSNATGALVPRVAAEPKPANAMPPIGGRIQLTPTQTRTTFHAGTANVAGHINVTDNTFIYVNRGIDPKYPNRILINTATGGGNGVSLALYYVSGTRIDGWKQI